MSQMSREDAEAMRAERAARYAAEKGPAAAANAFAASLADCEFPNVGFKYREKADASTRWPANNSARRLEPAPRALTPPLAAAAAGA